MRLCVRIPEICFFLLLQFSQFWWPCACSHMSTSICQCMCSTRFSLDKQITCSVQPKSSGSMQNANFSWHCWSWTEYWSGVHCKQPLLFYNQAQCTPSWTSAWQASGCLKMTTDCIHPSYHLHLSLRLYPWGLKT